MYILNRFIRLARVFIEGRGVPFLGAGISITAGVPAGEDWQPNVGWMVEALMTRVEQRLACLEETPRNDFEQRLMAFFPARDQPAGESSWRESMLRRIRGQLGLFCQAVSTLGILTHEEIVLSLKIHRYHRLRPTPAHYFIAFLAQENLLNETITTNYDCCLERAVYHSRGIEGTGYPTPESCRNRDQYVVSITDLGEYRNHGARRLIARSNQARLRVYKINGCAYRLARNQGGHCDKILLTDAQLRDMDDRSWALDLLRDRTRSKALVFSGFGSDEPQIRFTLDKLLEEFSLEDGRNGELRNNAIWVNAYDEGLSLTQHRLLQGFWRENFEQFYFSGNDTENIRRYQNAEVRSKGPLSADLFWQTVFEVVFLALVERYTRPGYPGWRFLSKIDDPPRPLSIKVELQQWLDPTGIGRAVLDREQLPDQSNPPLERIHILLNYRNYGSSLPWAPLPGIPLCQWLRAMEARSLPETTIGEVYYRALVRSPQSILFLLLLWQYCGDNGQPPFEIRVPDGPEAPRLYLRLGEYRFRLLARPRSRLLENSESGLSVNALVSYRESPEDIGVQPPDEEFYLWEPRDDNSEERTLSVGRMRPIAANIMVRVCRENTQNDPSENSERILFYQLREQVFRGRRQNRYRAELTRVESGTNSGSTEQ